jgi:hypothetical protein
MRTRLTVFLLVLSSLLCVGIASAQETRSFGVTMDRTSSSIDGPFYSTWGFNR